MKNIKEIYTVIEKYVSKDALTWILKDCLTKNELETIAHQCRIESLTNLTTSKSPDLFSREISQEFFKNPKARELVAHYLNSATLNEINVISKTSIPELLNKLRDPQSPMIATGQVGKYLWALLVDDRAETMNLIPIFILKVLETIRRFTNILQELKKKEPLQSKVQLPPSPRPAALSKDVMKFQEELTQVRKELSSSRETIEKLQKKNAQLEDRIQDLQEQYKTTLAEAQHLKHDKNLLTKKIKDLEMDLQSLELRHQNLQELQHKTHQYEREIKMMKYELDKKNTEMESILKIKSEYEKHQKLLAQLERRIKDYESQIAHKDEEIYRIKENIKKESVAKKVTKKIFKSSIPRVGIFVDVQNIFYASKEKYESKLDFQKLLHETLQGRRLVKASAYVVKTPEINQENFISLLESIGYEVKIKSLKIRLDGSAKGDWDLGIAIDMISMIEKIDVAVLVSGDGDFVDLVRMLQTKGIRVEVASFLHNTSGDLIDAVDLHFPLDEKILL
jgi:uncharacterized LabA/DUF88 family protein/predicted  nucleic acid-binding Zn-ribbon protein